jgi:hypothetical protein
MQIYNNRDVKHIVTLYHNLLLHYLHWSAHTSNYNWLKVKLYGSATSVSMFARNTVVATIVIANTILKYCTDRTV